jgi:type II secretory pathway pseudopilin PulG
MRGNRKPARRGFTLVDLVCVGSCVAALFALTAPAIQKSRSDARSQQCRNNLKQLALALHNYHDVYKGFPPGWVSHHRLPGKCYGYGWPARLLPFVEQVRVFNRMDFNKPMRKADKLLQTKIPTFRCPVDPTPDINPLRGDYGTSNYSGNYGFAVPAKDAGGTEAVLLSQWLPSERALNWPGTMAAPKSTNGTFYINSKVGIRDIVDGTSNTLLVSERSAKSGAGIWPGVRRNEFANDQVTDCSPGNEINSGTTSFSSYHGGGVFIVLCDGSARFLSEKIESKAETPAKNGFRVIGVFQKLSARNDGQPIGEF